MRYGRIVLVSVGIFTSSEAQFRGGLVKPHLVSLIQSVTKTRPVPFEDYEKDKYANNEFCQPASTFFKQGNSDLEYMEDLKKSALHALSDTRKFLQTMEYDSKQDDYRRAQDMKKAWDNSVDLEVKAIIGVLEQHSQSLASEAGHATELATKAAEGVPPAAVLDGKPGDYKATAEQLSLQKRLESNKAYGNTKEGWEKIAEYNSKAKELAGDVKSNLEIVLEDAQKLFTTHLTFIRTNGEYALKWPSDFSAESFEKLMAQERKSETDESSASATANAYKKQAGTEGQATSETQGGSIDTFFETADMGIALMDLLKSGANLEATSLDAASPSEKMDKLTTLLNVLQIRRLGLQDARRSLVALINLIQPQMQNITGKVTELVGTIGKGLEEQRIPLYGVYKDAEIFVGADVFAKQEGDDYGYESLLKALEDAEKLDLHESMKPRAAYIVNAVRQLHAHLLSLVGAHSDSVNGYTIPDAAAVKTDILKASDTIATKMAEAAAFTNPDSATSLDAKLTEDEKNARRTALCILYGRVDGLQNLAKLDKAGEKEEVNDMCADSHTFGMGVINASSPDDTELAAVRKAPTEAESEKKNVAERDEH